VAAIAEREGTEGLSAARQEALQAEMVDRAAGTAVVRLII
jgi:hypothetical protein